MVNSKGLAIARNMVKPFDIMLADEPTGSLDDENKSIVIDTLLALNKEGVIRYFFFSAAPLVGRPPLLYSNLIILVSLI